jgi:hypothetical protein
LTAVPGGAKHIHDTELIFPDLRKGGKHARFQG